MTQTLQPAVLYVGNDPSLEYLLGRYAQRSGCRIESIRGNSLDLEAGAPRPLSVWFSSLEVLESSQALRAAAAGLDIPLVVCAAVSDDARALDLGADFIFLHPVTYDFFLSTLGQANLPMGDEQS
jgi:hypothetical protein